MNDKELKELNIFKSRSIRKQEKIEEVLELINSFEPLEEVGWDEGDLASLVKGIKKILEE